MHKARGDKIGGHGHDRNRVRRFVRGASCGVADTKDNVRSRFAQCRRGFRELIIAKIKAIDDDLEILPVNEAEQLELVKKCRDPR